MKSTRVIIPVVFEEFEVAYIFLLHFFTIIVNLHKVNKNLGGGGGGGGGGQSPRPPPPPGFYGPVKALFVLKIFNC